eukprot:scaffold123460_cov69-Phaeocystis_antarctica.AAC.1
MCRTKNQRCAFKSAASLLPRAMRRGGPSKRWLAPYRIRVPVVTLRLYKPAHRLTLCASALARGRAVAATRARRCEGAHREVAFEATARPGEHPRIAEASEAGPWVPRDVERGRYRSLRPRPRRQQREHMREMELHHLSSRTQPLWQAV